MKFYKIRTRNIWLQRMTTIQFFTFILRGSFGATNILYDEHQATARSIGMLVLFKMIGLCGNFHPAALSMSEEDSLGYAHYREMLEDIEECLESVCKRYVKEPGRWHKQMVKSYLASFLWGQFSFLTMVRFKVESDEGLKSGENIAVILRTPFNFAIKRLYAERNIVIAEAGCSDYVRHFAKPLYYLATLLLSKILPVRVRGSFNYDKPAIWVEWTSLDSFIDPAFWRHEIKAADFDILCYFDRAGEGSDSNIAKSMESRGLKWLNLDYFTLLKLSGLQLSAIAKLFRKNRFSVADMPPWMTVLNFEYNMWFLLYESLYKRFKVKILIQHQEASWKQGPQSEAMESAGGIMIGYHWSNYYHSLLPSHLFPQHVYFVWGNWTGNLMRKIGNSSRHMLPSGLWILKDNSANNRKFNGLSKDLDFVMAIFDSSIGYNVLNTPASLAVFYKNILQLLEENPRWGAILKCKNLKLAKLEALPGGSHIVSKMKVLIDEKRLAVLDRGHNPLSASANADLSVCYSFNSAGIVSAIHGYNAIHWDCIGISPSIFCDDPEQKVVYSSCDQFKKAIMGFAAGDKSIGDLSRWRKEFNHFDDLLGPVRIGRFVQRFMDDVIRTGDAGASLRSAVREYRESNLMGVETAGERLEEACPR